MECIYLSWQRPAIDATVDYLVERYQVGSFCDMSRALIVVPGGRLGRRLHERLAHFAQRHALAWFPPQVTTVGQFPERLYVAKRPFASPLVQQMAWGYALRESPVRVLEQFIAEIPADRHDPRWIELGAILASQHAELAADGLDFRQVAEQGEALEGFPERPRWEAMAGVQSDYLALLDRLELWDRQTARLYAIAHQECQTTCDVILLGTVDMSRAQRQMLDLISSQVTALVFADASFASAFDEHGCLRPEAWRDRQMPLRDHQLRQVDGPADQADAVVEQIAAWSARYEPEEMTIGVPDESLVALVHRAVSQAGAVARYGPGSSVEATRPVRLLRAIADYLSTRQFSHLWELTQHPDPRTTLIAIARQQELGDFRPEIDAAHLYEYFVAHLPYRTDEPWLEDAAHGEGAQRITRCWDELLGVFQGEDRWPRDWVAPLLDWLDRVYGDRTIDRHSVTDRLIEGGVRAIVSGIQTLRDVPTLLANPVPAWQAILMSLSAMTERQVAAHPEEHAMEMLGWLELPWDDAPALIVTQCNEGTLPTSANSDLFLPDRLRSRLGIDDNARRYARDAYALTTLCRTRADLRLIIGRRNQEGYPLLPSRLVFATDDARRAARCLQFFGDQETEERVDVTDALSAEVVSATSDAASSLANRSPNPLLLCVPRPAGRRRLSVVRVTDFGIYLKCPYRFYLTRVAYAEGIPSVPRELDGASFGNLLHTVVERLAIPELRDVDDELTLRESLLDELAVRMKHQFGETPRPILLVQRQQMEYRLRELAREEAQWRRQGWRTEHAEISVETAITPWSDVSDLRLKGRIDRIDRHLVTGHYAILDYKSGDQGASPEITHHGRSRSKNLALAANDWIDLQLPLYRHLVREMGIHGRLRLGYISLPRSLDKVGFQWVEWTERELAIADEVARHVVQRIDAYDFWPPTDHSSEASWDAGVDRVCQVGVFGRQLEPPHDGWSQEVDDE